MKLTKQQEKEVMLAYNAYWDSYIKGDVKTMITLLDDDYNQIGSAESEVFFNKKDAVKFLYETIDQVAGKAEIRNRIIKIEPLEEFILINDLFDIYVLIETKWSFYSKFRASTLLQKKEEGWKFIHQHSSMPDTRTQKGENIAVEKISAENLQLREAVKRRTIELEQKKRELEIEASLERVRTVAMSMNKSDDLLSICEISFKEFQKLGFNNLRNAIIHILNDEKGFFLDYDFSDSLGGSITNINYNSHPVVEKYLKQIKRAEDAFAEVVIEGNQLNDWKEFRRRSGQRDDNRLDDIPALYYYFYSIGVGDIGISTFKPIDESQIKILKRFRNVFDLAYRTYTDITKAEAQAREAQIELALERVRARTMAMHQSSELSEAGNMVFQQIKHLGIHAESSWFWFIDLDTDMLEIWTTHENKLAEPLKVKASDYFAFQRELESWKNHEPFLKLRIPKQDAIKAILRIFGIEISNKEGATYFHLLHTRHKYGFLGLGTWREATEEEMKICVRFAKVFEQTYTRFLDLQKAEAQAREAQIEAALERVRSRTMGMQKSEELKVVIQVVYEQFVQLNIFIEHTGFIMDYKARDDMHIWLADQHGAPSQVTTPYFDSVYWNRFNEAKEKGMDFFATNLTFEEKNKHYQKLFQYIPGLPGEAKEFYFSCPGLAISTVLLENVGLYIENFSGIPYSDEENKTLIRFGNVFQQTYTRFLDLQKAEAQAREAQIETALERVRASAMAMHNSEDLAQTVDTFFSELNALNVVPHRCGVGIVDEESRTVDIKANTTTHTNKTEKITGKLKLSGHPVLNSIFEHWKLQKEYHPVLHGKEIVDYYKVMNPQITFPDFADDETQYGYYFYFKEGGVFAWTDQELAEGDLQIFRRYTSVLSLTYRRYMDLKEAEAQAREAKIETALEKVRSRTMAMHQSDELAETAAIVFKQLISLGIAPNRLYIGIIKDNIGEVEFWITDEDGTKVSQQFTGNVIRNLSMQKMYDGWKSQKKSIAIDMQGDELKVYFRYLSDELHVPFKQGLSQKRRVQNIAYFSQGFIGIASPDVQPNETIDLLERFAAVFNLTYTRFNDLQQAEAQNKIIQAENERKTMELEEARLLQLAMLPKELPQLPNLDIAVYMQTATEVGGDYYDFQVGIDGTLTTIIGDATGHGMKAGTVVTITKSLFNSMAASENILGTFDKISQVIKGMKFRQLAMCLLMMKIRGNRLSISSAAMPPALIYRANNKTVDEIFLKGMPLGTMKKFPYKKIESHLYSGDRILVYSDGLPELANDKSQMYGYERTKTEFQSVGEKEPEEIVEHLKNSASQWANGKYPDDDITFVVLKVK